MTTMKAWSKRNGVLQLVDVPRPEPGTSEILVRVKATSLNRGEVRGVARAAEGAMPGWDVAGIVETPAADRSGPPQGARVCALVGGGAWAEFVRIPASHAAVVPEGVGLDVAATLPIAALTAMRAFDVAGPLLGKRILVTGGSGGVGQFAIQLGTIAGASVTAISSRSSQHEELKRLGASEVVTSIESAKGVFDFILESVGGSSLAAAIGLVAPAGVVVIIGNSSEQETTFNARTLYAKGGATIYGLLIFEEMASRRAKASDLERLLALVAAGRVVSPIHVRWSWLELPGALADLEKRAYPGKAVLTFEE